MSGVLDNIISKYKSGDMAVRLVFAIVLMFVVYSVPSALLMLFNISMADYIMVALPADVTLALARPWTFITYMFFHYGLIHIILNALCLYVFGGWFLSQFSAKHLRGLFIVGGFVGGLTYLLAYNIFPFFSEVKSTSYLVGASASVMAVLVAITYRIPDMRLSFMLLGTLRLKYFTLVFVLIDLLYVTSNNGGGHIAHIGGALTGLLFVALLDRGFDITKPFNWTIDMVVSLFSFKWAKRKPKMRVEFNTNHKREDDYKFNKEKKDNFEEIGLILDKLKARGYDSLSKEEKKKLFDASRK
ncbi:MAG: rhomboid family intramembrane serine protease [Bacteroides sp.]|nr:rhomboid family intramembrane serine protease [Bacteroides sp.]